MLIVIVAQLGLGVNETRAGEPVFSSASVKVLCSTINGQDRELIPLRMEQLITEGGITKAQWNNHYAFKVYCIGHTPLELVVKKKSYKDFKVLADFGINLDHPITDTNGNISTVKDFSLHKYKTVKGKKRIKWKNIYMYLKKNKNKSCKEQPQLQCNAPYVKR